MVFVEACGSEDGDAWSYEVELSEAADELGEDFECGPEFLSSEAWSFEEVVLAALWGALAPGGLLVGL